MKCNKSKIRENQSEFGEFMDIMGFTMFVIATLGTLSYLYVMGVC